jgi:hypothetical protein
MSAHRPSLAVAGTCVRIARVTPALLSDSVAMCVISITILTVAIVTSRSRVARRCVACRLWCVWVLRRVQELRDDALARAHDLAKDAGEVETYRRVFEVAKEDLGAARRFSDEWVAEASMNASGRLKVMERDLGTATSTQSKFHTYVRVCVRGVAAATARVQPVVMPSRRVVCCAVLCCAVWRCSNATQASRGCTTSKAI